jgi:hypothetical protein
MLTFKKLYDNFQKLDTDGIIQKVFVDNASLLEEKNREQLLAGKTRDGSDLFPTYQQDPYFKTPGAAQRYSDWKDSITPHPTRKKGVPNLFIVGTYHRSRKITITANKIIYSADFIGPEIEAKYGEGVNGLGGEFKRSFLNDSLKPDLQKKLEGALGLKFKKLS